MRIRHEFVKFIPDSLEQNVVYVSIRYRTMTHLCMCGCGNKVVTPIRPERWQLLYDGSSISLKPSVGNWDLPRQSHYWITNDEVIWSHKMNPDEIRTVKAIQRDRINKHYVKKTGKHWWFGR